MKLGIIGAMDVEVATLKAKMEDVTVTTRAGMEYFAGKLEGLDAVVVQCGVGKINAAMCTQILIDCFGVTAIVNTGIAGSLRAELDIGDLVISRDAIHHDFDLRFWGRPIGQVPGLDVIAFPADERLMNAAFVAIERGRTLSSPSEREISIPHILHPRSARTSWRNARTVKIFPIAPAAKHALKAKTSVYSICWASPQS
jgi:5'-methylthioadenosine/S-adenosylhomocysteine nucleosidase